MKRKVVFGLVLIALLAGMLTLTFNIKLLKASGTIYIRPDGSIYPPDAPILRDGDIYTFIEDIEGWGGIVVEKDNIIEKTKRRSSGLLTLCEI